MSDESLSKKIARDFAIAKEKGQLYATNVEMYYNEKNSNRVLI
jgi:hypothetical protein